MCEQGLHRLPVAENDKFACQDSARLQKQVHLKQQACLFEMSYLLNKIKVKDVSFRDVITVSLNLRA